MKIVDDIHAPAPGLCLIDDVSCDVFKVAVALFIISVFAFVCVCVCVTLLIFTLIL